ARERGALLRLVALADLAAGDAEAVFERVSEALRIIDVTVDASEVARLLHLRGQAYLRHGQLGAAVESLEASRDTLDRHEVADAVDDPNMRAIAETILARVALAEGDHEQALRVVTKAESALAALGDERQRADALRVMGLAHHAAGDHAASDRVFRQAVAILTEIKDQPDLAAVAGEYARLLRARGDAEAAFDMLELSRGPSARH